MMRLKRRTKAFMLLLIMVTMSLLTLAFFQTRLRPYVKSVASIRAEQLAVKTVNEAVVDIFGPDELAYEDVIKVEKNAQGSVVAVKAQTAKLNSLKSDMIVSITERISELPMSEISVPIGSIIGGELFAGRGFKLKVRLKSISYINVDFESVFVSGGINQTLHRIIMNVSMEVVTLVTTYAVSTTTVCPFCVAETVIVGEVPDSYTDIGLMSQDDYENINNYLD